MSRESTGQFSARVAGALDAEFRGRVFAGPLPRMEGGGFRLRLAIDATEPDLPPYRGGVILLVTDTFPRRGEAPVMEALTSGPDAFTGALLCQNTMYFDAIGGHVRFDSAGGFFGAGLAASFVLEMRGAGMRGVPAETERITVTGSLATR